jgi:hypothetical protein
LREHTAGIVVGRSLSVMGLGCALAGIVLGGVSVEIPGIALAAAGYAFAAGASDRTGQVLGVVMMVCRPGTEGR